MKVIKRPLRWVAWFTNPKCFHTKKELLEYFDKTGTTAMFGRIVR